MSQRIRWLFGELPGLQDAGVLDEAAVERVRRHYGDPGEASWGRLVIASFAVLGGVLVGSGVILLLAYNWHDLSRAVRTALSVAPLAIVQLLGLWAVRSGRDSVAWREGIGSLQALLVGSSIALVGQTYHIPGDLGSFLIVWMPLVLPIAYLMRAVTPAIFYLVGILCWAGYEQSQSGAAAWLWLLFAAAVPFIVRLFVKAPRSLRAGWMGWATALWLVIAPGLALEKVMPGLWIVVYTSLVAAMALVAQTLGGGADERAGGRRLDGPLERLGALRGPFVRVGSIGVFALALLLTYEWPWESIGWTYYRPGGRFHVAAAWSDYALVAVVFVTAIALWVRRATGRRDRFALYGAIAPLAALAVGLVSGGLDPLPVQVAFNLYLLALGLAVMASGVHSGAIGRFNLGLLAIAGLIVARFFDSDLGLVERGVVFILVGAGFLVANLLLARRSKRDGAPNGTRGSAS